ncbi:protein of unknown function (plasmid) [Cupriavidus taiwanensis]|uniref:DUF5131 family protein n=1 Tax=Cupriavidus taiwanensis TaxID=164546 RepID=A0A375ISA6_9BURK|nr:protein of unknown function [Cupriavidus taiwanensis]
MRRAALRPGGPSARACRPQGRLDRIRYPVRRRRSDFHRPPVARRGVAVKPRHPYDRHVRGHAGMSDYTRIEWADHTWNPWEGCQKVGPGCDLCYAEARNARFAGGIATNWGPGAPRRRTSAANWRKPLLWDARHAAFAAVHGRRQRVFCASLADMFDNAVPWNGSSTCWKSGAEPRTSTSWSCRSGLVTLRVGSRQPWSTSWQAATATAARRRSGWPAGWKVTLPPISGSAPRWSISARPTAISRSSCASRPACDSYRWSRCWATSMSSPSPARQP